MSATIETKYAEISVDSDDANGKDYHGYIAVRFNPDGAKYGFFMESYALSLIRSFKLLFKDLENTDVTSDDGSIIINLSSIEDKIYAPDVVRLVKQFEKDFDEKVG